MSNVFELHSGEKIKEEPVEYIDHDSAVVAVGILEGYLHRIGNVHVSAYTALGTIARYFLQLEAELIGEADGE